MVCPQSNGLLQNLSGSNIGEDASNVRNNLRLLAATELPEEAREAGRTEVLPVQWRKHLRLDASALPTTCAMAPLFDLNSRSREPACCQQLIQSPTAVRTGVKCWDSVSYMLIPQNGLHVGAGG